MKMNNPADKQRNITSEEILNFWFSERVKPLWFNSNQEFDTQILYNYRDLWQQAKAGKFDYWCDTAEGSLALIIILDQFPLNMFRGQRNSFSTEAKTILLSKSAIAQEQHNQLSNEQKGFLYMPLMHSENLVDHNQCIEHFSIVGLEDSLRFAMHHRELIIRFGRFPHRNDILGRKSTQEELAYLDSKGAFLG